MGFDTTGRRNFTNSKVRELLETHFSKIQGNALEVGCGTGIYADFLNDFGFKVEAFDINHKSIEVAKEKYSSDIHFFSMDVEEMHTLEGEYDLVLDWGLLDLYGPSQEEKRKYFDQVHRVLKPGGIFALFCFNINSFGVTKPGERVRSQEKGVNMYFTPMQELTDLLEKKFSVIKTELITAEKLGDFPVMGNWVVVEK